MTIYDHNQIASLKAGKVTYRIGHGKSMEPKIMNGSRQTLIPVLSHEDAVKLGCTHYNGENPTKLKEGDLYYILPEEINVGDAVFCKCKYIYTHEVHAIAGKIGELRFYIGRHDKKHYNGWTRNVYGLCVHSE